MRIYIDTSVIGGCFDEEFQEWSQKLFEEFEIVTSSQIGALFGFKPRTNAKLCKDWINDGFLDITDSSNKGRKYKLSKKYEDLLFKK